MDAVVQIQLGKNGLTDSFLEALKKRFQKNKNIKISVLKSACRDKQELKEITNKILDFLGNNYKARTIGYTIAIKKFRRAVQ